MKAIWFAKILLGSLALSACAPSTGFQSQFRSDEPAPETNLIIPPVAEPSRPTVDLHTQTIDRRQPTKPSENEIIVMAPKKAIPIPAWALKPQSASWTTSLIRALRLWGQDLVRADIRDAAEFCPAYSKLTIQDRMKVWIQLISAMAKSESDLNPISAFTENFVDADGKPIVSRGLLQISKSSANAYGCNIQKETDLEDSDVNLQCGVRILNSLVPKYHAIHGQQDDANSSFLKNPWRGAARYWSVLRGKAKDWLIRNSVRQLSVCSA